MPHFLYGSPDLHQSVLGLSPSEEHHNTFLDVEPVSTTSPSAFRSLNTKTSCNANVFFVFVFWLLDNWIHPEVCEENSNKYGLWAVKTNHVSTAEYCVDIG